MKFIHIGDAHIRSQTWANLPQVTGDASKAVDIITAHAKHEGIKTLVLSGDVFHSSKPTSADVGIFHKLISAFDKILYIEGNHEKAEPPWLDSLGSESSCEFIHLRSDVPVIVDIVHFCGIDYTRSRDELMSRLDDVRRVRLPVVLVMHAGFKHMINFEGASNVSATDLDGIDCQVLVSHVHKRVTYKNIHSPGPLFPQSWEEVCPCYVDVITTDPWTIDKLDVTVRNYYTVSLKDLDGFTPDNSVLPSVVRVLTDDPKDIIPEIHGCIVVPVITGSSVDPGTSEVSVSSKTIEQAIMEDYEDPEDGLLMLELYKAESPKEFIDKFLTDNNISRRTL